MSFKFNASKCCAIVAAWPDLKTNPQLVAWLHAHGVTEIKVHRAGGGDISCGYNFGVELALASKASQFIFADRDIFPGAAAEPFFSAKFDVVGVKCNTGHADAFASPEAVHAGLWRTRRRVLEAVGARPFRWILNAAGTAPTDCLCRPFLRRAAALGFSTGHAGEAFHVPRSDGGLPMYVVLQSPPAAAKDKAR